MLPRFGRLIDICEPAVELLIRLSGWSAIFFVFCIFIFIFKEGAPFIYNSFGYETGLKEYVAEAEDKGNGEKLSTIEITEFPYEIVRERALEEIHEAIAAGQLGGVRHARVERDKDVRLVLYLEPGTDPEAEVENLLEVVPLRQGYSHMFEFFSSSEWRPDSEIRRKFGIFALLVGSLSVTFLAMLFSVPLSLGAAIFVSEFCSGKTKEALKILIEILAAIPSVVWGFIGYMIMNPIIIWLTGRPVGINMLNGGIVLAFMSIPIIVSLAEDALKAVPDSYREAAVALGASRWEVVYKVLLPAAKNGLLAAVLLGVGRCIGETMAVLMVTGHSVNIPSSPLDPVRTMTATIAAELGEAVQGGGHFRSLFLIGIVLMMIAFAVNFTADLIVKGVRGKQNA